MKKLYLLICFHWWGWDGTSTYDRLRCSVSNIEWSQWECGGSSWSDFLASNSRTSSRFAHSWGNGNWRLPLVLRFLDRLGRSFDIGFRGCWWGFSGWQHKKEGDQSNRWLRHEILSKALKHHSDRQARPVTVFPNFEKLSGAWILAFPNPYSGSGLSSKVFSESMTGCQGSA